MLIHERQEQARKLRDAIIAADAHFDTVSTVRSIDDDFTALLERVEGAKDDCPPKLRGQMNAIFTALSAIGPSFTEARSTANHGLANAEQAVVIHRSKVAA